MENNLPRGWVEIELIEVAADTDYPIGDGDHGQIKPAMYKDKGVPYIRVSDMGWGNFKPDNLVYIDKETHRNNLKSELLPGDVLIAKTGATIGKCCIVPDFIEAANTTSSVGKVTLDQKLMSPKYLLNYFLSREFKDFMWSISERTAQPGFNIRDMVKFKIPLPPKAEHDRIVAKLDAIMQKVESNKQRLDKIPKLLKRFRQSVLAAAVSGKLTEDWREKNGIVEDWKEDNLGSITTLVTSGSRGWAKYYSEKGSTFVRAQNISKDVLDLTDIAFVKLPNAAEGIRTLIRENDILVTITGANVTKTAHVDFNITDAYVSQHVGLVRVKNTVSSKFVYLFLISESHGRKQLLASAYGQGKPQLNLDNIKEVQIFLPLIDEQTEIVRRVEQLFAFADKIEARYTKAKTMLDKLPQSILAKAFRGELVAQNPNDEPASVLLERIASAKLSTRKLEKEKLAAEKKGKKSNKK